MVSQPSAPRLPYAARAGDGVAAFETLDAYVDAAGLEPALLDLVRLRASLINGCAYCVDMHTKDLHGRGESMERVAGVSVWKLAPYYSDRERAALAWTDAVTKVADGHVSDEAFETARAHFGDKELVDLTLAVIQINGWNRIVAAFRPVPGKYKVAV